MPPVAVSHSKKALRPEPQAAAIPRCTNRNIPLFGLLQSCDPTTLVLAFDDRL
jgi:hypothetical protein